eukprot:14316241-Alexandrium_andersonii.AAC.1
MWPTERGTTSGAAVCLHTPGSSTAAHARRHNITTGRLRKAARPYCATRHCASTPRAKTPAQR